MADFPISLNLVTLSGVVDAAPIPKQGADGEVLTELVLLTGVDGRAVKHRVRISDPELARLALASEGRSVFASGELAYDAEGAFVAVLARRGCDLRVAGEPGERPAAVVAAPVAASAAAPAPTVEKPVVAPEPEPSPEPAATVTAPVKTEGGAFRRGGFGGRLGGLNSKVESASPEADESPAEQPVPAPKPASSFSRPHGFRTPAAAPAAASPRPPVSAPTIGADAMDDDIPF